MIIESDRARALSGIRHGVTTGAPISLLIPNRDWDNWQRTMAVEGEAPADTPGVDRPAVKRPRPGHADLAGIVQHVTLFEFADQLKADAVLVSKLKSLPNVTIHVNAQTTEITGDGQKVNGIRYKDRVSGEARHVELEGVFVQIGLVPNTEFLKGTVELSKFGEIVIDAKCHTNVPGVFAAGDVTTVPYKQIIIAAGEGAKAALSAFDYLIRTPEPVEVGAEVAEV